MRSGDRAAGDGPEDGVADAHLVELPDPPYWTVVFVNRLTPDMTGAEYAAYHADAARMVELAARVPGYLGFTSARAEDGRGISVSYWADHEAIDRWRTDVEHARTRERGRRDWYAGYQVQVARVERAYGWRPPTRSGPE